MLRRIINASVWLVAGAAGGWFVHSAALAIQRGLPLSIILDAMEVATGLVVMGWVPWFWWETSRRREHRRWQRSCYPSRWWEGVELPTFLQNR